ncbi:MAG TPA: FlgD immunoglobulin-like domain containing protein [Candidatus Krumholzibacteria bacterium]
MSAHPRFRRTAGLAWLGLIAVTLPLAARASSIGLYTDETGSSCSFSGNSAGLITTYVMIRPDERGLHGVRFSAPIPSCLGAVFVEEFKPTDAEIIGDSQTGVSVAFYTCATAPRVALQINYYRGGSTSPCCAFPIVMDPYVEMIEGVDCNHESLVVEPVVSHFNADATCACTQPANFAPLAPSQPQPANHATTNPQWSHLAWSSGDPEHEAVTYQLYFGDHNPPPLLASELWDSEYDVVGLSSATPYYWRVVARDPHGSTSESPVWTFTTMASPPPNPPSTPSPKTEAQNQPLDANLAWTCFDPESEALTFDVYFGTAESPPLVATNRSSRSFDPGPLSPSTVYHWRVVARDPHGVETEGPTWTFSSLVVSSFSVEASNMGVNVTWRLVTDEGMSSYALLRSEQGSETSIAVAQGAVTGPTGSYFDDTVEAGKKYAYELSVVSDDGTDFRSASAKIGAPIPQLELGANRPNPFNPRTTIPYYLRIGGRVQLAIYDPAGRLVRTLVDETQLHGEHDVVWDGTDDRGATAASGVYFARLKDANGELRVRKLVMLK